MSDKLNRFIYTLGTTEGGDHKRLRYEEPISASSSEEDESEVEVSGRVCGDGGIGRGETQVLRFKVRVEGMSEEEGGE